MNPIKKILLVDSDVFILNTLKNKIQHYVDVDVLTANSYKESVKYIREEGENIAVAIVDLELPEAKEGSVLYLTSVNEIPSIVFTDSKDSNLKAAFMQKHVIEYIQKNTLQTLEYTAKLASRIIKNYHTNILIVDDSSMSLNLLALSLEKMHFKLHKAKNGIEALKVLEQEDEPFSLVITDYHMPHMDGLELTQEIRKRYKKDELAIIALSAQEDQESTSLFLKVGANDFVKKPFTYDELALRINLNLDMIELFSINKMLATKDDITSAHNERFFLDSGEALVLKAQRAQKDVLLAFVCLDGFEDIKQKHGPESADEVLRESAKALQKGLRRSDLLARQNGAIFSLLFDNISREDGEKLLEKIHHNFSLLQISIDKKTILTPTLSIGAVYDQHLSFPEMMVQAMQAMQSSQKKGKGLSTYFDH